MDTLSGLSQSESRVRLKRYGLNKLPETEHPDLLKIFLRQFNNHFIYVLIVIDELKNLWHNNKYNSLT